jgi:hypothetical protein
MMTTWKVFSAAVALAALLGAGSAFAQGTANTTIPGAPITGVLHQQDAVSVIPYNTPGVPGYGAQIGTASSMTTYFVSVPLTGFTITAPSPVTATFLLLNPAGTLATGTLTMPATPNDGGSFCVMSTQTQTALTVTANTGQTVAGTAVSALTAYVPACWRWWALTSTWSRLGS